MSHLFLMILIPMIDSCVNDCVLFKECFRGNFSKLTKCPAPNAMKLVMRRIQKLQERCLNIPLALRLSRMFKNQKISHDLQSHMITSHKSTFITSIKCVESLL